MPRGAQFSPQRAMSATALSTWQEVHAVDFSGNGPKFFRGDRAESKWNQDMFWKAANQRENTYTLAINTGTHASQNQGKHSAPVPTQGNFEEDEQNALAWNRRMEIAPNRLVKERPNTAARREESTYKFQQMLRKNEERQVNRAFSTIKSLNGELLHALRETKDKFKTMNSTLDVLTEAAAKRRTHPRRPRSAMVSRSRPQSAKLSSRSTYSTARDALDNYHSRPKSALPGNRPPLIGSRPASVAAKR